MKNPLYTIGYGNRKINDFLKTLGQYKIEYLIDVRSKPFSKFQPEFNKNELNHFLKINNIKYVFMGDVLGGRPDDDTCYYDGKVDYEVIATKTFYRDGIDRLKTAHEKNLIIVLMCSELKPQDCHRSKLIGRTLSDAKINVQHIDENGSLKDQLTVMNIVTNGFGEYDLFGASNLYSRKKYRNEQN